MTELSQSMYQSVEMGSIPQCDFGARRDIKTLKRMLNSIGLGRDGQSCFNPLVETGLAVKNGDNIDKWKVK